MFLRPENWINIVQLQAGNLSEFFSVQEKEASSNKFSLLEGGPLVVIDQSNAFKICKFYMFHKSYNVFQQNQMMEKQRVIY
jgi:hypothetical protein